MTDPVGIAGDRVHLVLQRIEQLDTELQEINEQRKEVFAEAKGEGFDVKVLKEIIKLRKQDKDERDDTRPCSTLHARDGNRDSAAIAGSASAPSIASSRRKPSAPTWPT